MLIVQFLPSLAITVLNVVVPLFFEAIALVEKYMPQNRIKITIFRYMVNGNIWDDTIFVTQMNITDMFL